MLKKFLIIVLSAAFVTGLASCGTSASADTASAAAKTEPVEAETAKAVSRAEWSLDDIAALSDIVTGVTDREYAVSEGADYKIHEDIAYDRDIVYTVLFDTAAVRFDVPGEYEMIYWIYFDAAALKAWADENGLTLDIPDTDRLAVWVYATVTVTEAEEEEDETEEDAEGTADVSDGDAAASTASGSAKSGSSGTVKGGSSSCNHNWVATKHNEEGHYESVLVTEAYDSKEKVGSQYFCNNCSYTNADANKVITHCDDVCNCGYHTGYIYETVHHDAVYEKQWVVDKAAYTTYKCSKCGAVK